MCIEKPFGKLLRLCAHGVVFVAFSFVCIIQLLESTHDKNIACTEACSNINMSRMSGCSIAVR